MTKQAIERLLRKRYKRRAWVRKNNNAPTPVERERLATACRVLQEDEKHLHQEKIKVAKQVGNTRDSLYNAAQFVLDTDACVAAMHDLAMAVDAERRRSEAFQDWNEANEELKRLRSRLHRHRWEACVDDRWFTLIAETADTLAELADKVQNNKPKR